MPKPDSDDGIAVALTPGMMMKARRSLIALLLCRCIFLLVVAMFVNAHNRRTAAFVAETHSDIVLLACSGNRRRSRATLVDCDETRSNLFRAAQAHDRAVLLDGAAPSTLDALSELPEAWARSTTRKPLRATTPPSP